MTGSDLSDLLSSNVASLPLSTPRTPEPEGNARRSYRTIWISDVHLG
ncbi:MAG: UDP-2,3-diacylglucosamine diphosphatase, partial [Gammaproteobacteria bacterium]|nr:UDP-2,3-diacylglucosamine diphosphatase [Gammaproteobacteria bacterium]